MHSTNHVTPATLAATEGTAALARSVADTSSHHGLLGSKYIFIPSCVKYEAESAVATVPPTSMAPHRPAAVLTPVLTLVLRLNCSIVSAQLPSTDCAAEVKSDH